MTKIEGKRELTFDIAAGETVEITYKGYEKFTILNRTNGEIKVSSTNDFDDEYFIIPTGGGYSDYTPNPCFNAERTSTIYICAVYSGQICITSN